MILRDIIFFVAAIGALAGAIGVVTMRNPFYSVVSLVVHLVALATLFLLLRAEFLAAAQVVVYAGAVMVLYVFVVAYVGGVQEALGPERGAIGAIGALFAAALLVEIMIAVIATGLKAVSGNGAHVAAGFGSPAEIGRLLLQQFLIPFEGASFLLLVAAVGAVVLARRRRGLEQLDPDELPERVGESPLGRRPADGARPTADDATWVPAGTAEGAGDPHVERSPDHAIQEPAGTPGSGDAATKEPAGTPGSA